MLPSHWAMFCWQILLPLTFSLQLIWLNSEILRSNDLALICEKWSPFSLNTPRQSFLIQHWSSPNSRRSFPLGFFKDWFKCSHLLKGSDYRKHALHVSLQSFVPRSNIPYTSTGVSLHILCEIKQTNHVYYRQ